MTNKAGNNNKPVLEKDKADNKPVFVKKRAEKDRTRKSRIRRRERPVEEFEQRIIDIARVTRVMAGGKRMRFRACVAVGNKKGKVGVGVDKGADVSIAVNKAINKAKKEIINVPIVDGTIPHSIYQKFGAAKILLKPVRRGRGVIAGGPVRVVLDLAGIKNITSKNLGTNNKLNIAKCAIRALDNLKKVDQNKKQENEKKGKKINPKKPAKAISRK